MSMTEQRAAEWRPDVCIYHAHCDDGFGAAWAVWRRWGDAVEYVPMGYGSPLPHISGNVLMVDYSLKRNAMIELADNALSVVVLDHHKTAQEELASFRQPAVMSIEEVADYLEAVNCGGGHGYERVVVYFDMAKSGARLAWEFCHPGQPMPRLLEHVEDRDLWRFKLEWTKEISAALRSYDHDFNTFETWTSGWGLAQLESEGRVILRAHDKRVCDFLANAYMAEIAGHTVPVLNVPYQYASDCGHALLNRYPDAPFAATWVRTGDGREAWSLRSEDSREDVGKIAAGYGGGGHRNSSGFSVATALGERT